MVVASINFLSLYLIEGYARHKALNNISRLLWYALLAIK
jgi:hypothetical protein